MISNDDLRNVLRIFWQIPAVVSVFLKSEILSRSQALFAHSAAGPLMQSNSSEMPILV